MSQNFNFISYLNQIFVSQCSKVMEKEIYYGCLFMTLEIGLFVFINLIYSKMLWERIEDVNEIIIGDLINKLLFEN